VPWANHQRIGFVQDVPRELPILRITEAAAASGVSAAALRAWERRHGFPLPERTSGGQRLYSRAQVEEVARVRERVETGVPVAQAIVLVQREGGQAAAAAEPRALADRLFAELVEMRGADARATMAEAAALLPVEVLALDVAAPAMRRIGEGWARGELGVDQEHYASVWLREWIDVLGRLAAPAGRLERLLTACPEGEQHDLGLALMGMLLRRSSFDVVHLGASVPARAIVAAATRLRPRGVLLSISTPDHLDALARAVRALGRMPKGERPRVAVGGPGLPARVNGVLGAADRPRGEGRASLRAVTDWLTGRLEPAQASRR
jgi:DNA-binding transcriptional MerR regulator/methylmalonyl-CoA mutase cobalamin-binding subunit